MGNVFKAQKGVSLALLAAFLFGASTPVAKQITPSVAPVLLAGLLYLGSGIGLATYWGLRKIRQRQASEEVSLSQRDLPWISGAVLTGGVLGPVLLMWGLGRTPASTASLLLNLEGVLTALLAWFWFRESFDQRIAWGMAFISTAGLCLSWTARPEAAVPWSALAIVGACLAWAVDNNLTRKVSASDPVQIAAIKGLIAGGINTGLALGLGARLPGTATMLAVAAIGFLGYGLSLTLFVLALRHLGTARTGAYFSVAPFVGALLSVLLLGEHVSAGLGIAALLMCIGVWLHVTETHSHTHVHESMLHAHPHTHDAHHQHAHRPGDPTGESHTHPHEHDELEHAHPHYPDIHHRHDHPGQAPEPLDR